MKLPAGKMCRNQCGQETMWIQTPLGEWELVDFDPVKGGNIVLLPDPISGNPDEAPPVMQFVSTKQPFKYHSGKSAAVEEANRYADDGVRYRLHDCGRSNDA